MALSLKPANLNSKAYPRTPFGLPGKHMFKHPFKHFYWLHLPGRRKRERSEIANEEERQGERASRKGERERKRMNHARTLKSQGLDP